MTPRQLRLHRVRGNVVTFQAPQGRPKTSKVRVNGELYTNRIPRIQIVYAVDEPFAPWHASRSAGRTSHSRQRFQNAKSNEGGGVYRMEHLGIAVAQRPVTLHREKHVTLLIRSVTSVTDRPIRPIEWDGRDRPTFGITYPLTDRPDGPPLARDRFLPQGISLGRLSLAQGRPHRPHTLTRTCTH